jgi:hypothetical protein
MSQLLAGVLPVAQLPFLESKVIDSETLGAEVDWLLERDASELGGCNRSMGNVGFRPGNNWRRIRLPVGGNARRR